MSSPLPPTPSAKLAISPAALEEFNGRSLQVPSTSATPSLDGSMNSDELTVSSCPSTPDVQHRSQEEDGWDLPVQLHPHALAILHNLSPDVEEIEETDRVIEVPEEAIQEMQQITGEVAHRRSLNILATSLDSEECEPISALSIPSPGGFFSSLGASARHAWCSQETGPSTSTAEQFYGVPWKSRPDQAVEHRMNASGSRSDGPVTARLVASPTEISEVSEIKTTDLTYEYNEEYFQELKATASASIDRTSRWLSAQSTCFDELRNTPSVNDLIDAAASEAIRSGCQSFSEGPISSPSKTSVHFLDVPVEKLSVSEKQGVVNDPTFYQGFQHIVNNFNGLDAFVYRQTRAEALQVERRCLAQTHRNGLLGEHKLSSPMRPSAARPVSTFLPAAVEADLKEIFICAEKERQALENIKPATWNLEASKMLNGDKLLTSPAAQVLANADQGRVLDLGGQPACDWAWQVAVEHRNTVVYTVAVETNATKPGLKGPSNHRLVTASNLWTLPFPDAHFDLISARSLYSVLHSLNPTSSVVNGDEYDLCLRECHRCLKPGGYLEYSLLDAEVLRPGRHAQALSVEFAFNLKTRGYDPCASKSFIPRLRKAGFSQIKRAHLVLPMADATPKWTDSGKVSSYSAGVGKFVLANGEVKAYEPAYTGSTADVKAITGVVGSWAWEKWMLKLQMEMGKDGERLLEGVATALEEGGKCGAGWRVLTGFARK
ncbi:hypothetical protein LTR04_000178 [Oleoguttula sp. CCFEE 6159]|nr:hypothetical protein LTR04_000178 [Oleoguttula sp. CCFEE 6159]